MKPTKWLIAAALIAAVIAVYGSHASISYANTVLCHVNENPCKLKDIPPEGSVFGGGLKEGQKAKFEIEKTDQTKLPDVTCSTAGLLAEPREYAKALMFSRMFWLYLSSCKTGAEVACTVEAAVQLPYSLRGEHIGEGKASLAIFESEPGSGIPGFQVKCPGTGLNCIFRVNEADEGSGYDSAHLVLSGGNPATVTASKVELRPETPAGGNCLGTKQAWWTAEYSISYPALPLFQSEGPPESSKTVFCSAKETPCNIGKTYGVGTKLTLGLTVGSKASIATQKENGEYLPSIVCNSSSLLGEVTEYSGWNLIGKVSTFTLGSCTIGAISCTTETIQTPYKLLARVFGAEGSGKLILYEQPGGGQPGMRLKCTGYSGFDCIFKVSNPNAQTEVESGQFALTGGNPATAVGVRTEVLEFKQIALKPVTPAGGNCLSIKQGWWDVSYSFSSPNPLYLSES